MTGLLVRRHRAVRSMLHWLPHYYANRLGRSRDAGPKRIWVTFADHFEPWWHRPDEATALDRVRRWTQDWPRIADRWRDSAGRPACYTFFYPEEEYHPHAIDSLARICERGVGDVEVHLHHDNDAEQSFVERVTQFLDRLHRQHGLLRAEGGQPRFAFIHGNWALDNSRPDGRYCGLNNEITLLRQLGCYADLTLPSAPSPTQTRMLNTIYWATDDPRRPRSHETGVPVRPGGGVDGDLMMIPGPLTFNVKEWRTKCVPRLETGELAGNCIATPHRARLWVRVAPRIDDDVFIKLFAHGAPEKNAGPLLAQGGILERTLEYVTAEARSQRAAVYFVSAWQMFQAIEALRTRADPTVVFRTPVAADVRATAS